MIITKELQNKIRSMREEGHLLTDIAEKLGVGITTAHKYSKDVVPSIKAVRSKKGVLDASVNADDTQIDKLKQEIRGLKAENKEIIEEPAFFEQGEF